MLSGDLQVKYSLAYREHNRVADMLAKAALCQRWNCWRIPKPLDDCADLLINDLFQDVVDLVFLLPGLCPAIIRKSHAC